MKNRLIALTVAIIFVLTLSTSVSAKTNIASQKTGVTFSKSNSIKPVDLSSTSGKIIDLHSNMNNTQSDITKNKKIKTNNKVVDSGINNFEVSDAISIKNNKLDNPPLQANSVQDSTYQTFTVNGTFQSQGQSSYIGPISLQPGQICQAQLEEPIKDSSNYYFLLYELDSSNNLVNVDVSTYSKSNVPDAVGVVNRSSVEKTYYIRVYANQYLNSATTFTAHISIGLGPDSSEPNENAFTATKYSNNIEANTTEYSLSGAVLNSPYDNDWYDIYIPNTMDFTSISINSFIYDESNNKKAISNNVNFEFYSANGSELVKQSNNGNSYQIQAGHNYLRISALSQQNFSPVSYNFIIKPERFAYYAHYVVLMNGQPLPIQTYTVGGERYALLSSSKFEWIVTYYSPSGYLANAAYDYIFAEIYDKNWNPTAKPYYTKGDAYPIGGVAHLTMTAPVCLGANGGVSGMCYDNYVQLILKSERFGTVYDEHIFITSRIMS